MAYEFSESQNLKLCSRFSPYVFWLKSHTALSTGYVITFVATSYRCIISNLVALPLHIRIEANLNHFRKDFESFSKQLRMLFETTSIHFRNDFELSKQLRMMLEASILVMGLWSKAFYVQGIMCLLK